MPAAIDYVNTRRAPTVPGLVTIANGQSLSPAVDFGDDRLHTILMPAAWTAANLTFQVSADGVSYIDLFTSAGELVITAAAARALALDQTIFPAFRFLKVRSGTSGVPVAQGAARDLILLTVAR
jgi:hypothetical protein